MKRDPQASIGPLTVYYLLLDVAPILLIALPMTLIIITGEIDLSVASVVGLSAASLVGDLHQGGMSIPAGSGHRDRRRRDLRERSTASS